MITSENFAARLKQANLASKNDITDFVKNTDFDGKLKKVNKKVNLHNTKSIKVKKKLSDWSGELKLLSTKDYNVLLGRMNFTGNDGLPNKFAY